MRVIQPVNLIGSALTSSTIPEPDSAAGEVLWTAGTYNTGGRRIMTSTHKIYEVVATPSTTDQPDIGAAKAVPTWIEVSYTNRYRMFDQVVGTVSTESAAPLVVEVTPGRIATSVAAFNMAGVSEVTIVMDDPVDGEVYNETVNLQDNSQVVDWYQYFFAPIVIRSEFIVLDLPSYSAATTTVTFDGDSSVSVGTMVMGPQLVLGVACYGTSLQLLDFSRKERDEFGNFIIVPRRTAKLVDFDIRIDKGRIGYVLRNLSGLATTPCVWVGTDSSDDDTIVYGYYRNYINTIDGPVICSATLQIEGLI
jgi:hypothetical protein